MVQTALASHIIRRGRQPARPRDVLFERCDSRQTTSMSVVEPVFVEAYETGSSVVTVERMVGSKAQGIVARISSDMPSITIYQPGVYRFTVSKSGNITPFVRFGRLPAYLKPFLPNICSPTCIGPTPTPTPNPTLEPTPPPTPTPTPTPTSQPGGGNGQVIYQEVVVSEGSNQQPVAHTFGIWLDDGQAQDVALTSASPIQSQVEPQTYWPSGSLRFALASVVAPAQPTTFVNIVKTA
jgi:hypothetical protein